MELACEGAAVSAPSCPFTSPAKAAPATIPTTINAASNAISQDDQAPCNVEGKLGKPPSKWPNSGVGGLTIVICGTSTIRGRQVTGEKGLGNANNNWDLYFRSGNDARLPR